jgi:adenylate cyclase class 2
MMIYCDDNRNSLSMPVVNFEFKAKAAAIDYLENKLQQLSPRFVGEDHQIDTYFNSPIGRLKLREGNIENALIFYERKNTAGAKQSDVILYQHTPDKSLKDILTQTLGIKITVNKKRKIYFIENVKFHFDKVEGLGTFVEVEAIDKTGEIGIEKLKTQCQFYGDFFELQSDSYIANSYSDLLLVAQGSESTSE